MLFEFLELNYNKNNNKDNGEYIDLSQYKLDTSKNYLITEGSCVIGMYIPEYFNDNVFNDYIKLLTRRIKVSNNRGDISGTLDISKVYPCFHKFITENTTYNATKTRVNKDIKNNVKYAFSNNVLCCKINEKSKYYNENKNEFNKMNLAIIKPIFKMLNHYITLDKHNEIFTIFNECIVNKGVRSAIHTDFNNSDNISLLFTLGECISNLNLPDYNVSFEIIPSKSLLILPLKRMRHSNDEINENELKKRISIVFYNK